MAFRRLVCLLFYGRPSSNDLNNGIHRSEGFPISYGSQRGRSLVRRCPDDGFRHAAAGYKKKYLRNAELYEEGQTGNYNMLDGRLNNEPPVRPDLTDGQTDEEIRELVPEAKPSLMDRLKADKPEHEARQMIPPVPERER